MTEAELPIEKCIKNLIPFEAFFLEHANRRHLS